MSIYRVTGFGRSTKALGNAIEVVAENAEQAAVVVAEILGCSAADLQAVLSATRY